MSKYSDIEINDGVISYSFSERPPEGLDMRHCHDKFEIIYVIEGSGRYVIEGTDFPIRPRSLVVIPPLQYHCVEISPDASYERYVIHFSKSSISEEAAFLLDSFALCGEGFSNFFSEASVSSSISHIFERIEFASGLPKAEKNVYLKLLLSEMVLILSIANRELLPRDERELGSKVIKYLNDHIASDVSLDTLAKQFFVSKYYLCRAFKKHNGISVHGYINQKRVMYAKQLIESGESASGAAYRVGFGDYSAFYRAYVKIIGNPPTKSISDEAEVCNHEISST